MNNHENIVVEILTEELGFSDVEDFDITFDEMGLDSIALIELKCELSSRSGISEDTLSVKCNDTINTISNQLSEMTEVA